MSYFPFLHNAYNKDLYILQCKSLTSFFPFLYKIKISKVKPILSILLFNVSKNKLLIHRIFSINVFKSLKIFMWSHNLTFSLRHMEKETVKKFFYISIFAKEKESFNPLYEEK